MVNLAFVRQTAHHIAEHRFKVGIGVYCIQIADQLLHTELPKPDGTVHRLRP